MEEVYDVTLKHPSRIIIFGPSGSGKTKFVEKLLYYMKDLFGYNFDRIIYYSGESFPDIDKIHGILIEKVHNLPENFVDYLDESKRNILIIDDNMHRIGNDIKFSDLFTMKSRHRNITVIMIVQNLFPRAKFMRDISTNANYIVLMSNPREKHQINVLNNQVCGKNSHFIREAFDDATENKPYRYLLLDFNQTTPEELRVRTNIFPNEEHIVYAKSPKSC